MTSLYLPRSQPQSIVFYHDETYFHAHSAHAHSALIQVSLPMPGGRDCTESFASFTQEMDDESNRGNRVSEFKGSKLGQRNCRRYLRFVSDALHPFQEYYEQGYFYPTVCFASSAESDGWVQQSVRYLYKAIDSVTQEYVVGRKVRLAMRAVAKNLAYAINSGGSLLDWRIDNPVELVYDDAHGQRSLLRRQIAVDHDGIVQFRPASDLATMVARETFRALPTLPNEFPGVSPAPIKRVAFEDSRKSVPLQVCDVLASIFRSVISHLKGASDPNGRHKLKYEMAMSLFPGLELNQKILAAFDLAANGEIECNDAAFFHAVKIGPSEPLAAA